MPPVGGEFVKLNANGPCHAVWHMITVVVVVRLMRELLILAIHLLVTLAKLLRPGGVRAVAAESLLLKHQLPISNRPDIARRVSPFRCESILLHSHWVTLVMECSRAGSSVSASNVHIWRASRFAGCSTTPSRANLYRNASVPITIRCFAFIGGLPICAYSRSRRSSRSHTSQLRIDSS
jgi:hypothetical protein